MVAWKCKLIIPILLFANASAASTQDLCAGAFESLAYRDTDFPLSHGWSEPSDGHDLYAKWAATQANGVASALRDGKGFYEILGKVAVARQELAKEMKTPNWEAFGGPRTNPYPPTTFISVSPTVYPKIYRTLKPILRRKLDQASWNRVLAFETSRYTFRDGAKLETSFHRWTNPYDPNSEADPRGLEISIELSIFPPTPSDAEMVLVDVSRRADDLIRSNATDEAKAEQLLRIMYGYYSVIRQRRGSSAIGRSAFAGLYAHVFGRKMPELPDGIDVITMITTEEEFIEMYRPVLLR